MVNTDKFNFFIPAQLVKGTKSGQEMKIMGICSSEVEDTDGETLVPSGYDVTPLLSTGFLNYNHQANKDASAIIGEPTKAEIQNDGKDLYIEGFLYPDSEAAVAVYKLAQTLEKNSPNRRLGFSIEGKALEKDPLNPKRITKAKITGVAITPMPKNPNTLLNIMKGEYTEPFVELDKEEEEEIDKAITAASGEGVTSKESVDGGQEKFQQLQEDIKHSTLKKSEIYDKITEKYQDFIKGDNSKVTKIYQLTLEFNKKLYNMDNNEVLSKAVDNTFAFIDQQIDLLKSQVENTELEKSEAVTVVEVGDVVTKDTETNGGDVTSLKEEEIKKSETKTTTVEKSQNVDALEKSLSVFIKSELEKGNTSENIVDGMVMKGMDAEFCTTLVKGVVDEMSAEPANAGEVTTLQKGDEAVTITEELLIKGEDLKSVVLQEDFINQLNILKGEIKTGFSSQIETSQINFATKLQSKFEAFGNLVKSLNDKLDLVKSDNSTVQENLEIIKGENIELKKSLSNAQAAIVGFSKQPQPLKSVSSTKPIERFDNNNIQKSNAATGIVYDLRDTNHGNALLNTLSAEFDNQVKTGVIQKGDNSDVLGEAVYDLALTRKISDKNLSGIQPILNKLNIQVINNN